MMYVELLASFVQVCFVNVICFSNVTDLIIRSESKISPRWSVNNHTLWETVPYIPYISASLCQLLFLMFKQHLSLSIFRW